MHVLCLSTVFPNPAETDFGVFVERRMRRVGEMVEVSVVAPVAVVEYGNPKRRFPPLDRIPQKARNGSLDVYYPRWFYPPLGGWSNAYFLWAQSLRLARAIDRKKPIDLIDAHFGHPEGVAAALLARSLNKPFMITLRGNENDHAVFAMRKKKMAWAFERAGRIVTVSERLRQFAIELGCAAERAITIPNGIDGRTFYPRKREDARREFQIEGDAKIILSAGYLIERKGHHRVIEALRTVLDGGVNAQLLIAGGPGREGNFEAEIRKAVVDHRVEANVRFLGAVKPDALARLMSACDVFTLATSNEGWPNVVHEAMGCGAPVVATDIGAIPEMIQNDDFGYVVPFGDSSALADALSKSLQRSWNRELISQWAVGRSWDNVAAEVVSVMREAVTAASPKALKERTAA